MANARIVFANGSKDMAHNLDDLYERWMMRRNEALETNNVVDIPDEYAMDVFIPDLPVFDSIDEVKAHQELLKQKLELLTKAGQQLEEDRAGLVRDAYTFRLKAINSAANRTRQQLASLKKSLSALRKGVDDEINDLRTKRLEGKAKLNQLQRLVELLRQKRDDEFALRDAEIAEIEVQLTLESRAIDRQRQYIETLQKNVAELQSLLIDAYKTIIELQAGKPANEDEQAA